ncbi:lysophosphatidic acid receptor 6-like [Cyprinus carpio]|uniref:Lysophosphatidic acid receptor 6-like n=2 Tax=Cyprinus carpio TaxID=7962 RepID=A0A8C1T7G2_CYPCA|nr:lysophosphatidic acid receptor 6-like [Cyprinus carpio]
MSHSVNMTCQTMNCTNLEQNPLFVGVYSVVFIFGLTLNLTALVVFFRNSKSRSHTTMYMTHLAFADLLLVCTLPVRIYFHSGLGKSLPRSMCEFTGLIMLGNMYSSIFLLTCISFDRCIAVCFPLSSRVRECRKKAWCVCLGIWILTITTSLPIYFRKKKDYQKYNITCFGGFPSYATEKAPLVSTLILGFGIPLIIMILSSWGLIRAISKSTAVQTSDLVDSVRIKRMIITNLAIFLFCFLPYHIMLLILHASECSCLLLKAYRYSLMVACLNAMLDPVAYYFTTETFRRKMDVKAVRKIRPMNSHSSDGNNRCRVPHTT